MSGQLQRQLGVSDAVIIGAGSMIGAGVFASWAPASSAAGNGTLIALAIAGVVALGNATSSSQLAAIHTESGGTYLYGRRQLSPAIGHLAGWGFVVVSGWTGGDFSADRLNPIDTSIGGVLEAAGFMFFAFAGYARIATLGEEVKEPEITIPKAVPRALLGVLAIYLLSPSRRSER